LISPNVGGRPTDELSKGDRVFVTYSSPDRKWGEWVSNQLELLGYFIIAQHLSDEGGRNFVAWMDEALRQAHHVVALVSKNYLRSGFTIAEWTAAYALAMQGRERGLIPIRVEPSELDGLLSPITYIDLVGIGESEAQQRLRVGMLGPDDSRVPPFPGQQP
jgi:hypothetical protein